MQTNHFIVLQSWRAATGKKKMALTHFGSDLMQEIILFIYILAICILISFFVTIQLLLILFLQTHKDLVNDPHCIK
jgi:hypothetical protein